MMSNSNNISLAPTPTLHTGVFESANVLLTICISATNIFGLITNSINMAVFKQLWSRDTINISLFSMSLSDFLVCLTGSFSSITELPLFQRIILYKLNWHPRDFNIAFSGQFHIVFARTTLTITAFVTLERCLCVAIPLKVKLIFTRKVVQCIIAACYILTVTGYLPIYVSFQHRKCFYHSVGKSINCLILNDYLYYFLRRNWISPISVWVFYGLPFLGIVVCTAILIVVLKRKMEWRRNITSTTSSDKSSAKETGVIKMMVMVSSLFIVCNIPMTIVFIWHELDFNFNIHGSLRAYVVIGMYIGFVFEAINSSMNIFIYYNNSSVYKEMFHKTFKIKSKLSV